jgi:hypothetical protein
LGRAGGLLERVRFLICVFASPGRVKLRGRVRGDFRLGPRQPFLVEGLVEGQKLRALNAPPMVTPSRGYRANKADVHSVCSRRLQDSGRTGTVGMCLGRSQVVRPKCRILVCKLSRKGSCVLNAELPFRYCATRGKALGLTMTMPISELLVVVWHVGPEGKTTSRAACAYKKSRMTDTGMLIP